MYRFGLGVNIFACLLVGFKSDCQRFKPMSSERPFSRLWCLIFYFGRMGRGSVFRDKWVGDLLCVPVVPFSIEFLFPIKKIGNHEESVVGAPFILSGDANELERDVFEE